MRDGNVALIISKTVVPSRTARITLCVHRGNGLLAGLCDDDGDGDPQKEMMKKEESCTRVQTV